MGCEGPPKDLSRGLCSTEPSRFAAKNSLGDSGSVRTRHPVVRAGVQSLLSAEEGIEVLAQAIGGLHDRYERRACASKKYGTRDETQRNTTLRSVLVQPEMDKGRLLRWEVLIRQALEDWIEHVQTEPEALLRGQPSRSQRVITVALPVRDE